MTIYFNIEDHLNDYIARYIRKILFVNGVVFNQESKKFEPVKPEITKPLFYKIVEECCSFFNQERTESVESKVDELVRRVIATTDFEPQFVEKTDVDLKMISVFQHIRLIEEFAYIDLLSLGDNKFIVISTNRSTLKYGDIIESITVPWSLGLKDGYEFNLYRDDEIFIPKQLPKTIGNKKHEISYVFKTNLIEEIRYYHPTDIYSIVDTNFDELRKEKNVGQENQKISFQDTKTFIKYVTEEVNSGRFLQTESYEKLLNTARKYHIGSYTLNLIIELRYNAFNENLSTFVSTDWKSNIPQEVLDEIKEEERLEKKEEQRRLKKEYQESLKNKLKQGRFFLFFKRSGYYTKQSEKELKGISDKLEVLAQDGFGVKHWAESQKNDYLKKYEVNAKDNLFKAFKLILIILVLVLAGLLYNLTKSGFVKYNETVSRGDILVDQGDYLEAMNIYESAQSEFSPKITSFIAYFKTSGKKKDLNKRIDQEVTSGIENVKIFLEADKGIFKTHTEELLFHLLELRPENNMLKELKELWLKQPNTSNHSSVKSNI